MAWECADCTMRETEKSRIKVDTVCHHCGKPLCRQDRILIEDDEGFSDQPFRYDERNEAEAEAEAGTELDDAPQFLVDELPAGAGPVSRAAYHCKDCKKKYHPKAIVIERRAA